MNSKNNKRKIVVATFILLLAVAVFAGCGKSDNASSNEPAEQPATETAAVTGNADNGKKLYSSNCMACHGVEGRDGHNGADIKGSPIAADLNLTIDQITNGKGGMPGFKGMLTEDQIRDISAYVTEVLSK